MHISFKGGINGIPKHQNQMSSTLHSTEPPRLRENRCWNLENMSELLWSWCHDFKVFFFRDLFFYPIWILKYLWVWVSFLDVNHLIWYSFCYILISWCVLIRFQRGWVHLLNKFDCLLWESCFLFQLILFGFQIMILVWWNFFGVFFDF